MIPTWNDKALLLATLGVSKSPANERAIDDFAEVAVDFAEKTFVAGQVVAAMLGKLNRFACSVDDYVAGTLEKGRPWESVTLSLGLLICHHCAAEEGQPCYVFDLSSDGEKAVFGTRTGVLVSDPFKYKLHTDPLLEQNDIRVFDCEVFSNEDKVALAQLYTSGFQIEHRLVEERLSFFRRFCPLILEFTTLCLIYWQAIYQLLYRAPEDPFGKLTRQIRDHLRTYTRDQLLATCLVAMRSIVTFKNGNNEFYNSFSAFESGDISEPH